MLEETLGDEAVSVPVAPIQIFPSPVPVRDVTTTSRVLVPMISSVAPVARLIAKDPDTVTAGPPGCSVCEAIMYSEAEFRLTTDDPIVNTDGKPSDVDEAMGVACCCGRVEVEEPMTTKV